MTLKPFRKQKYNVSIPFPHATVANEVKRFNFRRATSRARCKVKSVVEADFRAIFEGIVMRKKYKFFFQKWI